MSQMVLIELDGFGEALRLNFDLDELRRFFLYALQFTFSLPMPNHHTFAGQSL